jgi:UDP-N-acetylmuramate dehydrogenase
MPDLITRLPQIEGATYAANVPLAPYTTIEVGGPAEVLAVFEHWQAVQEFLKNKPADVPFTIIGKGSNMVVADAGIKGVVAHFAKGLDAVRIDGSTVYAEAGAACGTVARNAREAGLAGLEFFGGIPGSIGGALRMNAGAYGHELIAPVACDEVLRARGAAQPLGHVGQEEVAHLVAIGVVDRLETVQVHEGDQHCRALARALRQLLVQHFAQRAAVG